MEWAGEDDEEAIEYFTQALKLKPKDASIHNVRGSAYFRLREFTKAIEDLTQAINKYPEDAEAYMCRGAARSELGNYEEAIEDLQKAADLSLDQADKEDYQRNMENYRSLNILISIIQNKRASQNTNQQADPPVEVNLSSSSPKITSKNLNEAEKFFSIGLEKAERTDWSGAIMDYTSAIDLNSNFAEAYYHRSLARSKRGLKQRAYDDYQEAISLNPSLVNPDIEDDEDDEKDDYHYPQSGLEWLRSHATLTPPLLYDHLIHGQIEVGGSGYRYRRFYEDGDDDIFAGEE